MAAHAGKLTMVAIGSVMLGAWIGHLCAPDPARALLAAPAYPRSPAPRIDAGEDYAGLSAGYGDVRVRGVSYDAAVADCTECSDFERGYRWAEWFRIAESTNCDQDSWSFRRGCAAFVRERRPAA